MSINTPSNGETRNPKTDRKSHQTPVQKAVENTKQRVHDLQNRKR